MRPPLSRIRTLWPSLLVALCVVLVVLSGTIQVSHFHPDGQIHPDCSLCVIAHSAPTVVHAIVIHVNSRAVETVVLARRIHMPRAEVFIRLISRPPPANPALFA